MTNATVLNNEIVVNKTLGSKIKFTFAPDVSFEDKFNCARDMASSLNNALELMQEERNALLVKVETATSLLKAADQQITQQKQLSTNMIERYNEAIQTNAAKVQALQDKLREALLKLEELENANNN